MPTDKWLVIDAHAEYIPPEALEKARELNLDPLQFRAADIFPTLKKMGDIEFLLATMDEAGVDMTAIKQTVWSTKGLEMCRALNDGFARVGRTYPNRFILGGHIPLPAGPGVLDELDRCVGELGLHFITLPTYSPQFTFDSPELMPVYEKISELGVPIVFHPLITGTQRWDATGKYEMWSTVMREYEVSKCLVEVMCGVLPQVPDLKVVFPHYGGGMPGLKARIRSFYQPEGWVVSDPEVNMNGKSPRELEEYGLDKAFNNLFDKLYLDMAGHGGGDMSTMKAALATLRTDQMLFGTDYPFDVRVAKDVKQFIENVKLLNIPDSEKRLILGETSRKLFRV